MRECGLKPSKGAVIFRSGSVTPYAGVWIETSMRLASITIQASLPMRECGLKPALSAFLPSTFSHSLCGSVD